MTHGYTPPRDEDEQSEEHREALDQYDPANPEQKD